MGKRNQYLHGDGALLAGQHVVQQGRDAVLGEAALQLGVPQLLGAHDQQARRRLRPLAKRRQELLLPRRFQPHKAQRLPHTLPSHLLAENTHPTLSCFLWTGALVAHALEISSEAHAACVT